MSDFNWKKKNVRRATYCKNCSRKYIKEHYVRNKQYYLEKARKRNSETRERIYEYLGFYLSSHPCVDCGEDDILILEFDHKERSEKEDSINAMITRRLPFGKLVAEVSKCEVRCANCHRRKTAKESGSWKLFYAPVA